MADPPGAFFKDETVMYQREVEPPAIELPCQPMVVPIGVEAEQGQPEAVLAAGRSMAAPGIAAGLHEDRHDIELEADGPVHCGIFDRDRQGDGFSLELDSQLGGPILHRQDEACFELRQGRVGEGVLRLRGNVPGQAI